MVSRHEFSWQQTPLGQPVRPQGVQRRVADKGRKLDPDTPTTHQAWAISPKSVAHQHESMCINTVET